MKKVKILWKFRGGCDKLKEDQIKENFWYKTALNTGGN